MTRLFAVCLTATWMVGCQCQPRTPVYDPFAAAAQRIAPPATGALNQSSGYGQAPFNQQPIYPPGTTYQPPAAYQVPTLSTPQPQIPPGYVPADTAPAVLTPTSRATRRTTESFVGNRNIPAPKPRADWPPRRALQKSDGLAWVPPNVPGEIRRASANVPLYSSNTQLTSGQSVPAQSTINRPSLVQPTAYWGTDCINCDPYNTPHIANPLLPMPLNYDDAYSNRSSIHAADQSYSTEQWRRRSSRR